MNKITKNKYQHIHEWLKRIYGKANKCDNVNCQKKSERYEWALLREKNYDYNRENFHQLCRPCHSKYDSFLKKESPIIKEKSPFIPLTNFPINYSRGYVWGQYENLRPITESIAKKHGIFVKDIMSKSRYSEIVKARNELKFALHEQGMSASAIGRFLGQNHTSVLYTLGTLARKKYDISKEKRILIQKK